MKALAIFRSRRMVVLFALGVASGLPLYLTGTFGTEVDGGGRLTSGDVRAPVLINCNHLYGVRSVSNTPFVYEFPTP